MEPDPQDRADNEEGRRWAIQPIAHPMRLFHPGLLFFHGFSTADEFACTTFFYLDYLATDFADISFTFLSHGFSPLVSDPGCYHRSLDPLTRIRLGGLFRLFVKVIICGSLFKALFPNRLVSLHLISISDQI